MATETTFWGYIQMNAAQAEKVKKYISDESYANKMIDKQITLSESSRGVTLAFGKVVRGGFEERLFWFKELEDVLRNIEAFHCTVCFEFEDRTGLFLFDYVCDAEGWKVYEHHFNHQNVIERPLN